MDIRKDINRKYYEAYDDRYRKAHSEGIRWFGEESSPVVSDVIARFHIGRDMKLLELGCGEGRDAQALLQDGFDVTATDISPEAIGYCKKLLPLYKDHFQVVDCVKDTLHEEFDFIYGVAVVHMLVLDEDRNSFYRFIYEHLAPEGIGLICSMGNGETECQSDIHTAFDPQERNYRGRSISVAGTSCRMVNRETFEKEIFENHLDIVETGQTCIPEHFPEMMYAVVKKSKLHAARA